MADAALLRQAKRLALPAPLPLDSGQSLAPVEIAYESYG
ncbi:MAG: homoserine O-acetyltransferase, partial [Novosphingobium sp.]|nr:homoserine O-acetyltransferase [Novosphingobium sp.]